MATSIRRRRSFFLQRLSIVLLVQLIASATLWADEKPGYEQGHLNKMSESLREMVKLTMRDGTLQLDRDIWNQSDSDASKKEQLEKIVNDVIQRGFIKRFAEQEAKRIALQPKVVQLFNALRSEPSHHRFSISSGEIQIESFYGGDMYGELVTRGETVSFEFREEAGPKRLLTIRDTGKGGFSLTYTNGALDYKLSITQSDKGRIAIVHLRDGNSFSAIESSFRELHRKNRDYIDNELLPLLHFIGVQPPLMPFNTAVIKIVLSRITPLSDERRQESQAIIEQLASPQFVVRQKATQTLMKNPAQHIVVINDAISAGSLGPEAKHRLDRVVAHYDKTSGEVVKLVDSLNLVQDRRYLVELLSHVEEDDRKIVARALAGLTGQAFGGDMAAWEKWLDTQASDSPDNKKPLK